jgi:hypothetical protein
MQSMAIRVWTLRGLRRRGKSTHLIENTGVNYVRSFGWVNASYVYGLQLLTAHHKRALGTLTAWEDYARATTTIKEDDVLVKLSENAS